MLLLARAHTDQVNPYIISHVECLNALLVFACLFSYILCAHTVCKCTQGQAQECLVEKSLKGIGRVKNVTISRLATRVSSLTFTIVCLTSPEPSNFFFYTQV